MVEGAAADPMLEHHSIASALSALEHSPLSRKKAMLLALLVDAAIDALAADDVLAHRSAVADSDPALALVMELCAMSDKGPRLILEPVTITPAEAATLREADYMVSLYNSATVQRVRISWSDGRREDALTVLRQAAAALER